MENSGTAESIEASLKLEEAKRRKREGFVILATTLMVLALAFFEMGLVPNEKRSRELHKWPDLVRR